MHESIEQLTRNLGRHLARYRIARNLKQSDLAEAAGIDRSTLSRLEQGRGTIDTLARVLAALDIGPRLLDLVPDARLNPLDPKAGRGEERQRVRDSAKTADESPWSWNDETR